MNTTQTSPSTFDLVRTAETSIAAAAGQLTGSHRAAADRIAADIYALGVSLDAPAAPVAVPAGPDARWNAYFADFLEGR